MATATFARPAGPKLKRARQELRDAVGRRLRELRGDMSQLDVALAAGVTTMMVSRAERGAAILPALLAIANGLGSDIAALFGAPDVEADPITEKTLRRRIGVNLEQRRGDRTLDELGYAAGLTGVHVGAIERGASWPSIEALAGLALALDCAPVELVRP